MGRFCSKHIKDRTSEEILDYLKRHQETLNRTDPRTKEGKRALQAVTSAKDVLKNRGVAMPS